jgi:hypothetical protein
MESGGKMADKKLLVTRHVLDQMDLINIELEEQQKFPLLDVVRSSGMTSTFFNYYMDDGCQLLNDTFPYMIIEGQLEWNVPYNRVTLEDFLVTHPACLQEGIEYETGLPAASGHGRVWGTVAVNIVISILRNKCPELGVSLDIGQVLIDALSALAPYYEEKKISVIQQLDAIISTGECGVLAIQELLDFDEYHARKLLLAIGFTLNEKTGRYVMGVQKRAETRTMLEKLSLEELRWL